MRENTTWTVITTALILVVGSLTIMLVNLSSRMAKIEAVGVRVPIVEERQQVVMQRLSANETADAQTTQRLDRYEVRINALEAIK